MTALLLVPLTGVSVIGPDPLALTPVSVPITVDVQLKVVPVTDAVGMKLRAVLLQISWINEVGEFVMTGFGSTVTITSIKLPAHPLAEGVIRYVTVPCVTPSVEVSNWLITAPLPALAPVTLEKLCTVQLKVVPATPLGLKMATLVLVPEQIPWLEAATSGMGRTITLTANGTPLQPEAAGWILYVTVPGLTPSVDVSAWAIRLPPPAAAPETFAALCTVQVNVVPPTAFGFVMTMFVVCPLQMAASAANASGLRFTVRVAVALGRLVHVPVITTSYCLVLNVLGTFVKVSVEVRAPLYTPPSVILTPFSLHWYVKPVPIATTVNCVVPSSQIMEG